MANKTTMLNLMQEKLLQRIKTSGSFNTEITGFRTYKRDSEYRSECTIYNPLATLAVQGDKRSIIGDCELWYAEGQYILTGIDMPATSHIAHASPDKPFLALTMDLDRAIIGQLILEAPDDIVPTTHGSGMFVADADFALLDVFNRLLDLLDQPKDLPVLSPMLVRELHYRFLTGPQGYRLRQLNTPGSQGSRIVGAVSWIREHYKEPFSIEELARRVNMSAATLHRQFKQITTLSPLQYQKRLRLHEAQRLMLSQDIDANGAGLAVGYESPHQFNREYKRLFGQPPRRSVMKLQYEEMA